MGVYLILFSNNMFDYIMVDVYLHTLEKKKDNQHILLMVVSSVLLFF